MMKGAYLANYFIINRLLIHIYHVVINNSGRLFNRTVKCYLEVFFLPAYSPELNPDECLNCDLKSTLHSREVVRSVKDVAATR